MSPLVSSVSQGLAVLVRKQCAVVAYICATCPPPTTTLDRELKRPLDSH
jgi:hypothetical protein